NHAAAALVSVSSLEGILLGAYGARAAVGASGVTPAGEEPAGCRHRRIVRRAAAVGRTGGEGAAPALDLVFAVSRNRYRSSPCDKTLPEGSPETRNRPSG